MTILTVAGMTPEWSPANWSAAPEESLSDDIFYENRDLSREL
ncbi:MAG: hypothetical protein V4675_16275 [Verrucomicrobiota bacterium]